MKHTHRSVCIPSSIYYNDDQLTNEIAIDPTLANLDLVQIFQEKKISSLIIEPLGETHKVKVVFKRNPRRSEEFDVDFNEFFIGDINYLNAIESDMTLPFEIV